MEHFAQVYAKYLAKLEQFKGAHHDQIRRIFVDFLQEAFPQLEELRTIEVEKGVEVLKARGWIDLLIGDLIFEVKRDLEKEREEGLKELKKYLLTMGPSAVGILTDGRRFEAYKLKGNALQNVDFFEFRSETAEEALRWLDSYLFQKRGVPPTAEDVAFRFGLKSPVFHSVMEEMTKLWESIRGDPSAMTKFGEWSALLRTVYGSDVGSVELFLRHTYLAIFARLLIFSALSGRGPFNGEIRSVVTGEAFEKKGFSNLVEDDFFSWLAMPQIEEKSTKLLAALARRLSIYDLSEVRQDLLKELYQELVDPRDRHDLGEFYTPQWLAELALKEAGFPGHKKKAPSMLDPACGSGTFLVAAINMLREAGFRGESLLKHAFSEICGLDIHPLAVAIAKANFILALSPELQGIKTVELPPIPIYMADSLRLPEKKKAGEPLELDIYSRGLPRMPRGVPSKFQLPAEMACDPEKFDVVVNHMVELAAAPGITINTALEGLKRLLKEHGLSRFYHLWAANLRLMRFLIEHERDTVYKFVLKNAVRPAIFAEKKFDFVCGNPPWLSYRFVKEQEKKKKFKELVIQLGLLRKGETKLFTQMELATLFFAFSYEHYLKPNGTIAFVMPRSVLTGAKQHRNFQRGGFGFVKFIDCENVEPLFNVPSCVVIAKKGVANKRPVPMLTVSGKLPRKELTLEKAKEFLDFGRREFVPPYASVKGRSSYLEKVFNGATIYPRCFWFVRPPSEAIVVDKLRPYLETDPEIQRWAKKPWKGITLSGRVEAEFLFATLLSTHLLPFGWRKLSLLVLPLMIDPNGRVRLVAPEGAVKMGKTGLAKWLEKAEAIWEAQKKADASLLEWLDYRRKLTSQRPGGVYKVVYNAGGTYLCSCVVDVRQLKGAKIYGLEIMGFFVQHETYALETENENEAHYLCAVLNSFPVDEAIKPFQPRGAWGARRIERRPFEVLPIPKFEPGDGRHVRLSELSRACHEKVRRAVDEGRLKLTKGIGSLRREVRRLLAPELSEIDRLVREIVPAKMPPQDASEAADGQLLA